MTKEYTPEELAVKRRNLALKYNEKMKELAAIKQRKAIEIIRLLDEDDKLSVAKAELRYATTEDGQKELELIYVTKGMLEVMRSVKTEVEMKAAEAFGQY